MLVFGGTGAVGSAALRRLRERGADAVFTWCRSEARARELERELGFASRQLDLTAPGAREAIHALVAGLEAEGRTPEAFLHCAATSRALPLGEIGPEAWRAALAVNAEAAFHALQALAPRWKQGGSAVLVGALAGPQALPLPVHFAASQGLLQGLTVSLAKELGPAGVRVNMVALGPLEAGLSRELAPRLIEDFKAFSALRRLGKPEEVAGPIAWLLLEDRYVSGEVIPINGGI